MKFLRGKRFLLINPPVYDFRLEWAQWHQPTGLLQLARLLLNEEKDVRLVDCLNVEHDKRIPRHKIGNEIMAGYTFPKWHYGLLFEKLEAQVKTFLQDEWVPETVFVTSLNSIWWESTRDTIKRLKKILPKSRFILGGAYPTVESEHAKENSGADEILIGSISEATKLPPDLSLYPSIPYSTGIYFYSTRPSIYKSSSKPRHRAIGDVLKEIKEKAENGVREFAFFDSELHIQDRETFGKLLSEIAKANLDVRFILLGNVSPRFITQDLAEKMRRAGVTQIYLHCDLNIESNLIQYTTSYAEYERCINALLKMGGFEPRDGNVAAMLVAGLPYEDLNTVSERLIQLAHIAGSVILVPFQYVPGLHKGPLFNRVLRQNGHFAPEKFNSKLYPLAILSGKNFEEYMELTRLAALLNSKYRSESFDFLGESLAAKMFRESIRTEGWNPFKDKVQPKSDETNSILLDLPVVKAEDR